MRHETELVRVSAAIAHGADPLRTFNESMLKLAGQREALRRADLANALTICDTPKNAIQYALTWPDIERRKRSRDVDIEL